MFIVEATYDGGPALRGREDQRWEFESLEDAAQRFESEVEPDRRSWPLAQIVKDLATEGRVEYEDPENCRCVVAYELVGAGV